MRTLTYDQLLYKAAAYCSVCERCEQDVIGKLRLWDADGDDAEKIMAYLKKENYLDEKRFCRSFVLDKFRYNKWGRIKISAALHQKGIGNDAIETALCEIEEKEYTEILAYLLQQKEKSLKGGSEYEKKNKLIRFALSRGFEMNIVLSTLHADETPY